jgi:hypothetical protein
MGARVRQLLIVGCEPGRCEEDFTDGLSDPVRAAVDEAVVLVESLVERLLGAAAEGSIPRKEVHGVPGVYGGASGRPEKC